MIELKSVRRDQVQVCFYVDENVRTELKEYVRNKQSSFQEIFENYVKHILEGKNK